MTGSPVMGVIGVTPLFGLEYEEGRYDVQRHGTADVVHPLKGVGKYFIDLMKGMHDIRTNITMHPSSLSD